MEVFLSSVVRGLETFRDAAAKAARTLKHDVNRAEDFGASPDSPQRVCLEGVRKADVTYSFSALDTGTRKARWDCRRRTRIPEAREHGGVLVFLQAGVVREPRQEALVNEVQGWLQGHFTATFTTQEELKDAVTSALHDFELSRKTGAVDEVELVARANSLVPDTRGFSSPTLAVVLVGGPRQSLL